MQKEIVNKICQFYGLNPVKILPYQSGYRNQSWPIILADGRQINLIIYKSEPDIVNRIKIANSVSSYLANKDLPVRYSLDNRIIRIKSRRLIKHGCIYNYLPGTTIPWESYTQKHIKLMGKTLSDMHASLCDFDHASLPSVIDEYQTIFERMQNYFSDTKVLQALQSKLGIRIAPHFINQRQKLLDSLRNLPAQALHMDFVRSNVLFSEGKDIQITGIIDFEKAALGNPIFDIARTLAFLIVDCIYKPEEKVRKYFIGSGYAKRGASKYINYNYRDLSLLDELIKLFLFYDFYKFLRHNPYESLSLNKHFTRTLEQLRKLNVIFLAK